MQRRRTCNTQSSRVCGNRGELLASPACVASVIRSQQCMVAWHIQTAPTCLAVMQATNSCHAMEIHSHPDRSCKTDHHHALCPSAATPAIALWPSAADTVPTSAAPSTRPPAFSASIAAAASNSVEPVKLALASLGSAASLLLSGPRDAPRACMTDWISCRRFCSRVARLAVYACCSASTCAHGKQGTHDMHDAQPTKRGVAQTACSYESTAPTTYKTPHTA